MCVLGYRDGYRVCVWGIGYRVFGGRTCGLQLTLKALPVATAFATTEQTAVAMDEVIGSDDGGEGSGRMGDHEDIGSGGGDSYDYDYDFDCGEEGPCLVKQKSDLIYPHPERKTTAFPDFI